jgi:murein DD-endopeptidase MepM/ murein hydrolase activator NlpD
MFKITSKILILGIVFSGIFTLQAENNIPDLGKLDIKNNQTLTNLRKDVRDSLYVIRSNRNESELPKLKFYQYIVAKDENFWTILSKSSLDMDTLISINDLSSPNEVKPGDKLFIPNMRGTIFSDFNNKKLTDILNAHGINIKYVKAINGLNGTNGAAETDGTNKEENFNSKPLFIPCTKISQTERSLFLGTGFVNPIKNGKRTSGFGTRKDPFDKQCYQFHQGIDIACPISTEVYAARSGKVIFSGYNGGYGIAVIIEHELGYQSIYGHLSKPLVKVGQTVKAGSKIALSGNTGRTTGPHLHFEVRKNKKPVNPDNLLIRR